MNVIWTCQTQNLQKGNMIKTSCCCENTSIYFKKNLKCKWRLSGHKTNNMLNSNDGIAVSAEKQVLMNVVEIQIEIVDLKNQDNSCKYACDVVKTWHIMSDMFFVGLFRNKIHMDIWIMIIVMILILCSSSDNLTKHHLCLSLVSSVCFFHCRLEFLPSDSFCLTLLITVLFHGSFVHNLWGCLPSLPVCFPHTHGDTSVANPCLLPPSASACGLVSGSDTRTPFLFIYMFISIKTQRFDVCLFIYLFFYLQPYKITITKHLQHRHVKFTLNKWFMTLKWIEVALV